MKMEFHTRWLKDVVNGGLIYYKGNFYIKGKQLSSGEIRCYNLREKESCLLPCCIVVDTCLVVGKLDKEGK